MAGDRCEQNLAGPEAAPKLGPFLTTYLSVSGASLTVINSSGAQAVLFSSDGVAALIDELQFERDEGPQWVATQSGNVVLLPYIDSRASWQVFGAAIRQLLVGELVSIPLQRGQTPLAQPPRIAIMLESWMRTASCPPWLSRLKPSTSKELRQRRRRFRIGRDTCTGQGSISSHADNSSAT